MQYTDTRPAIIEQVKDGSTFRVRLLMPEGEHQWINLALAGVRAPRAAVKAGDSSEPYGDEVSFYPIFLPLQGSFLRAIPLFTLKQTLLPYPRFRV